MLRKTQIAQEAQGRSATSCFNRGLFTMIFSPAKMLLSMSEPQSHFERIAITKRKRYDNNLLYFFILFEYDESHAYMPK